MRSAAHSEPLTGQLRVPAPRPAERRRHSPRRARQARATRYDDAWLLLPVDLLDEAPVLHFFDDAGIGELLVGQPNRLGVVDTDLLDDLGEAIAAGVGYSRVYVDVGFDAHVGCPLVVVLEVLLEHALGELRIGFPAVNTLDSRLDHVHHGRALLGQQLAADGDAVLL